MPFRKAPAIFLLLITANLLTAQDYWQQTVNYKMDITLLPAQHAIVGEQSITYENHSPDTLHNIYLHLYPNAYKDKNSIYAIEAREFHKPVIISPEDNGSIEFESFKIVMNGQNNSHAVTAFKVNDTILEASLPAPLPPGQSMRLEISFYSKIRKQTSRSGYRGFQYDLAQWYPKVCVYDETGWQNRQFHYNGEFYGEFGKFEVTLNTPFEYIIAATGVVTDGDPGWELVRINPKWSHAQWQKRRGEIRETMQEESAKGKMRQVTFTAEKVHDFAWNACPDFWYEGGEWDGIPIHVLYRSSVKYRWTKRVVERSARALAWFSEKVGRYPYPQLTVVHGLLSGGMEYPMLNMNRTERESLILHEVGHIYFYGILANNEWKDSWLDEGFTTFYTRWYMENRYGKWQYEREKLLGRLTWLQRKRPAHNRREIRRKRIIDLQNAGYDAPMGLSAEQFREDYIYQTNAYGKSSLFYDMLKYVVGDSVFDEVCQTFFQRWKFKHTNEERFRQICEEISGEDLGWFFRQWLHETPQIDYELGKIKSQRLGEDWFTEVTILKNGTGEMPVEVELKTKNGTTLTKRWDGQANLGKLSFTSKTKPHKVLLDPKNIILDNNRFNNGERKIEFMFEYPGLAYLPEDAYLVTWKPNAWGNKVDGFRPGINFKGKNALKKNLEIGAWVGGKSQIFDFRFKYRNNIKSLGSRTYGGLMTQKIEGRFEFDARLSFLKSKYYRVAPQHYLIVGFNHSKLLSGDSSYVLRKFDDSDLRFYDWQSGVINKAYARYAVNPRGLNWFSNIALGLDLAQKDWGGDYTFTSVFSEIKLWLPNQSEGVFARFYAKTLGENDNVPIQEQIFLDGANPRTRFSKFYLRSHGAFPETAHYHLPGGGNLRGYTDNPISGRQVLALNLEIRKLFRLNFLGRRIKRVLGQTSIVGFWDMANLKKSELDTDFYADAGVGLRFYNVLPDDWYTVFTGGRETMLRIDFPLWVNRPIDGDPQLKFRWVLGFQQAF